MWILFAFGSALFAGLTSILAKMRHPEDGFSTRATAIRTIVVLLFSWLMVAIVGSAPTITGLSAKTWVFLILGPRDRRVVAVLFPRAAARRREQGRSHR